MSRLTPCPVCGRPFWMRSGGLACRPCRKAAVTPLEPRTCLDCGNRKATMQSGLCGWCERTRGGIRQATRTLPYIKRGLDSGPMKPPYVPPVRPPVFVQDGRDVIEYEIVFDGR